MVVGSLKLWKRNLKILNEWIKVGWTDKKENISLYILVDGWKVN